MKSRLMVILFALLLAGPTAVRAAPVIIGQWEGTWSQQQVTASLDMTITDQVAAGLNHSVAGYFDWSCSGAFACSGREFFNGTLFSDLTFAFDAYALADAVNLVLGSYWGTVSADGSSIAGFGGYLGSRTAVGTWEATKVSEPSTLALIILSLAVFAVRVRRRAP